MVHAVVLGAFEPTGAKFLDVTVTPDVLERTFTFAKQVNGVCVEEEVFLHRDRVVRVAGNDVIHAHHIADMHPSLALYTCFDLAPRECLVVVACAGARIHAPDQILVYQRDGLEYAPTSLPPRVSVIKMWPVAYGILMLTKKHAVRGFGKTKRAQSSYGCLSLVGRPINQPKKVDGITHDMVLLDVLPDYPVAFGYLRDQKRHACFLLHSIPQSADEKQLPHEQKHDVRAEVIFVDPDILPMAEPGCTTLLVPGYNIKRGPHGHILAYYHQSLGEIRFIALWTWERLPTVIQGVIESPLGLQPFEDLEALETAPSVGSFWRKTRGQRITYPGGEVSEFNHHSASQYLLVRTSTSVLLYWGSHFLYELTMNVGASTLVRLCHPVSNRFTAICRASEAVAGTKDAKFVHTLRMYIHLYPLSPTLAAVVQALQASLETSFMVDFWRDIQTCCLRRDARTCAKVDPEWRAFCMLCFTLIELSRGQVPNFSQPPAATDWDWLQSSGLHLNHRTRWDALDKTTEMHLHTEVDVSRATYKIPPENSDDSVQPTMEAAYFMQHIERIFLTMHLLYEDTQLHELSAPLRFPLGQLLYGIARLLGLRVYTDYYTRMDPTVADPLEAQANFGFYAAMWQGTSLPEPLIRHISLKEPPNLLKALRTFLAKEPVTYPSFFPLTSMCLDIFATLTSTPWAPSLHIACEDGHAVTFPKPTYPMLMYAVPVCELASWNVEHAPAWEKVLHTLVRHGVTKTMIDVLNAVVAFPIRECLQTGAEFPNMDWPDDALVLLGRDDIALLRDQRATYALQAGTVQSGKGTEHEVWTSLQNEFGELAEEKFCVSDSVDPIESDAWIYDIPYDTSVSYKDRRAHCVARFLNSSKPMSLKIHRRPEQSDHDFEQFKQAQLGKAANRQASLPVGRGAFTLGAMTPFPTEELSVPPLILAGRFPPQPAVVSLDPNTHSPELNSWAEFNNGVARALQVAGAGVVSLTRGWIVQHKNPAQSHAGLLFGLGLRGHLRVLATSDCYKYLQPQHEGTMVAILIGVPASSIGSMLDWITRMCCMHIPSALPTAWSDMSMGMAASVQCAAMVGIGLLYAESEHRTMTEFVLGEINRRVPDKPFIDRDGYSLAAGWSLGMICLGRGAHCPGLADLRLDDRLLRYIHGGKAEIPLPGMAKKEIAAVDPATTSSLTNERDGINHCVTSLGGCIALALLYLQSNDHHVAERIEIPLNTHQLDYNRPGLTLLRLLTRSLILWDSIEPTHAWIQREIPPFLARCGPVDPFDRASPGLSNCDEDADLDWLLLWQTRCSMIAALCLAIGLRFAGSGHKGARDVIISHLKSFRDRPMSKGVLSRVNSYHMPIDRATLENCQCITALALSIVASGSGDLECLRALRSLRKKNDLDTPYGVHMSIHMALGFLFLGGGRYCFQRDRRSIGCLLLAVYPSFPSALTDNRAHLQAFRHLYSLAAKPKCVDAIDVLSGQNVGLPIRFYIGPTDCDCPPDVSMDVEDTGEMPLQDTTCPPTSTVTGTLPKLLPHGHSIEHFEVTSDRFWPLKVDRRSRGGRAWLDSLAARGVVLVKKRHGFSSHDDNPVGIQGWFPATASAEAIARLLVIRHSPTPRDPAGLPIHWIQSGRSNGYGETAQGADLLPHWASILCCKPKNILPEHVYHFDFEDVTNHPLQRFAPQLEKLRDISCQRAHLFYECVLESKAPLFPALVELQFQSTRPSAHVELLVLQSFYSFFAPRVFQRSTALLSSTFLTHLETTSQAVLSSLPSESLLLEVHSYYRGISCQPWTYGFISAYNLPLPDQFVNGLRTYPGNDCIWGVFLWLKRTFPDLNTRRQVLTLLANVAEKFQPR